MTKIYIRKVHGDQRYTISFGTEKDVKDWKEEQKEWEEEDFSVADDSIELLCEFKDNNIDEVLQKINIEMLELTYVIQNK